MGRFETQTLTRPHNLKVLFDLPGVLVDRVRKHKPIRKLILDDAAFAKPEVYRYLEPEGYSYAIRLPANTILYRDIDYLLTRPVGRPPRRPIIFYHSVSYRAASWEKPRRVVVKVEWRQGQLFAEVSFIVTNLRWRKENVVRFYNQHGTAEHRLPV